MKTLFFETTMGGSGDMILGALLGIVEDKEAFIEKLNNLGLEGVEVSSSIETSSGIAGNRVRVLVDGHEENDHHKHHHKHGYCCGHHKLDKETGKHKCCGKHHKHEHNHDHHDDHGEHNHDHYHGHYVKEKHQHGHCCGHHKHKGHKHHGHHHNDLATIGRMIDQLNISEKIKTQAKEIYQLIAAAESLAHNKEVDQIHFHEVGEKDAVFDIVAVCLAMEEIGAEKILSTPVHVGYGKVKTSHGKLPIPTPATAEILRGIPVYSKVKGELCTPTGAALLKYFVQDFTQMPLATWDKIGYGVGSKEFSEPNILRAFLGHVER